MNERYRYGYGEDFPNRDFPFSRQGAMTDRHDDDAPRREVDVDERPEERPERADEEPEEPQADRTRPAHAADEPRESDPGAPGPFQRMTSERGQPTPPAWEQETGAPERGAAERGAAEREAAEREAAERDEEDAPTSDPDDLGAQRPASQSRRDSIFDIGDEPAEQAEPPAAATAEREAAPSGAGTPGQASSASERPPIALGPPAPAPAPAPAPEAAPTAPPQVGSDPAATAPLSGVEAPVARAAAAQGPSPRRPSQVESRSSLLAAIDRDSIRSRFLDIQAGFVDEPRQSVQEAERFVDELVQRLVEALETERAKLKAAIDDGSTEDLRLALRGYRAFVDRLLSLTM